MHGNSSESLTGQKDEFRGNFSRGEPYFAGKKIRGVGSGKDTNVLETLRESDVAVAATGNEETMPLVQGFDRSVRGVPVFS